MKIQSILLICSILVAYGSAYLYPKPKVLVVTAANQHELGLPIGTELKRDPKTKLYVPPPITDEFNPEARLEIQFTNKVTARNYCRVGPKIEGSRITRKFYWDNFCRDSDGEDLCCGRTKCSCNMISENCSCLSKDGFDFYEMKRQKDFDNSMRAADTAVNAIAKIGTLVIAAGK